MPPNANLIYLSNLYRNKPVKKTIIYFYLKKDSALKYFKKVDPFLFSVIDFHQLLMSKTSFAFLFFGVLLLLRLDASGQVSTTTPETIEKVSTEEIKVNASITTTNGNAVTDLKFEDLVIKEDDRLQQANSVHYVPANVLILLDVGNEISYGKRNKVTAETARALITALKPADSVALIQYSNKAEVLSDWTKDKAQLLQTLNRKVGFAKYSNFYEAVQNAVVFFKKEPRENCHLVLITNGIDSFNKVSSKTSLTKELLSSNINVHIISYTELQKQFIEGTKNITPGGGAKMIPMPSGAGSSQGSQMQIYAGVSINTDGKMKRKRKEELMQLQSSEQFLAEIAENTNGEIFLPATADEMVESTLLLTRNIDSQYVITYTPKRPLEGAKEGETRIIEVFSRRSGFEIQSHRKFVVTNKK